MLKNNYVQRKDIRLGERNLNKSIPVLTCGTGSGKTEFAAKELPAFLADKTGKNINTVWYLVPTEALRTQYMNRYGFKCLSVGAIDEANAAFNNSKYISYCGCYAALASYLTNNGEPDKLPDLIILDEIDISISYTSSFCGYPLIWEFLQANRDKILLCGLTATPYLLNYVNKHTNLNFFDATPDYQSCYSIREIIIYPHSSLKTMLNVYSATPECKRLCYIREAIKCFQYYKNYDSSGFLISKNKELLNDEMDKQTFANSSGKEICLRDYVREYETVPPNINTLFINDAWYAGINLKDDSFNIVICESAELSIILQTFGRCRNDIDKLVIAYNLKEKQRLENKIIEMRQMLNSFKQCPQDENNLSYEALDGTIKINPFALAYLEYQEDIYKSLSTDKGTKEYFNYLLDIFPSAKLVITCKTDSESLARKANAAANNDAAKEKFNIKKYKNIKIFSEEKEEIIKQLGLLDSQGRAVKWPTVKKYLTQWGYTIADTGNKAINPHNGKRQRYILIS